jgi:hypothetical protein
MCIVSIAPKGTDKDSQYVKDFIVSGMKCNTDGSGYMYKRAGEKTITVVKGFFENYQELIDSITAQKLQKEDELVIHHRIGTSGKVTKENCHPFVLSKNHKECCALKITTEKLCLVHNGYFSSIDHYMSLDRDFSDTYAFSRYVLSNPLLQQIMLTDKDLFRHLTRSIITSSKVAILHPEHDLIMLGDFIEDKGYYHSNHGYCRYVRNVGGSEDDTNGYGIEHAPWNWQGLFARNGGRNNTPVTKPKPSLVLIEAGEGGSKPTSAIASLREDVLIKAVLSRKLPNVPEVERLVDKSIILDTTVIELSSKNCIDFYYMPKDEWLQRRARHHISIYIMSTFDKKSEYTNLVSPKTTEDGTMLVFGEKTANIGDGYYLIPKLSAVQTYKDYFRLVAKLPEVKKQTVKKINNIIRRAATKDPHEGLRYKRLNTTITRRAFEMFVEIAEKQLAYQKYVENKYNGTTQTAKPSDAIADAIDAGLPVDKVNKIKDLKDLSLIM